MPAASSLSAPSTRRGASRRGTSRIGRRRRRVCRSPRARVVGAAGETGAGPRVVAAAGAQGWTLRASAGTQYQLPPLAALYGLLGNPALRRPHAFEIDGGVEHAVGGGQTLSVDVYRRR